MQVLGYEDALNACNGKLRLRFRIPCKSLCENEVVLHHNNLFHRRNLFYRRAASASYDRPYDDPNRLDRSSAPYGPGPSAPDPYAPSGRHHAALSNRDPSGYPLRTSDLVAGTAPIAEGYVLVAPE